MYKKDEFTLVSGAGIIAIIVTGILGMDLDFDEIVIALINRTIILIPTVFMCLVMFKNKTLSNTVLSIVLPLILISIIFKIDICVAIYVGCICLAMILFGYFNKNYKLDLVITEIRQANNLYKEELKKIDTKYEELNKQDIELEKNYKNKTYPKNE